MFWLIGIVAFVLMVGLAYLLRRHEVGHKAAVGDLRRGLPLMAMGLVAGYGLMRLLPISVIDLLVITPLPILIGYGLWRRGQAGSVLLNPGRSSSHKMFVVLGGLFMLLSIVELVELLLGAGTELTEVFLPLGMLSFGAYFLFIGWSGVEFREAGIFSFGQLVKWERIESYEFGVKTLTVRQRWWFQTVNLPVRPLYKDAVSDLLARCLQEDPSRTGD